MVVRSSPTTSAERRERRRDQEALASAAAQAAEGAGALVVVRGPAGTGKSALLDEAAAAATGAGLWVLRARARDLERERAFGVALQLLGPALAALPPHRRDMKLRGAAGLARPVLAPRAAAPPAGGVGLPAVHGLYWFTSNLADDRPLALVVDDVHVADEPSLRLCAYLAERIEELPVLLVVALRCTTGEEAPEPVRALGDHPLGVVLRPGLRPPG